MTQHISGFDEIDEDATLLRDKCRHAFEDGLVTQDEQRDIVVTVYQLCCKTGLHAVKSRIALRLLKGGLLDNRLLGEAKDAQALGGHVVSMAAYRRVKRQRARGGGPPEGSAA